MSYRSMSKSVQKTANPRFRGWQVCYLLKYTLLMKYQRLVFLKYYLIYATMQILVSVQKPLRQSELLLNS